MRRAAAAALLALSFATSASELDRELEAIASDPAKPLASLAVVAIRDGRVVYERNATALYRIASITKLVVAIGVMRLVEEGKLDLDTDIGTYLGYRVRNPHFPDLPVTLRSLLSHTSSLRDDADYVFPPSHQMREFLVPGGKSHGEGKMWSAKAPPGQYFAYCNLNSVVIGTVMEAATHERFDRLMQRLVIDPLGMTGGFNPAEMPAERVAKIATIYRKDAAGAWVAQVDDYSKQAPVNRAFPDYRLASNGGLFGPQGNLRASAADLGRVMRMLMDGGMIDGKRFMQPRTVEAMFARQWKWDGANGDTSKGTMQAWGLGNQQFVDASAPNEGDRWVEGGGFAPVGHTGDAYGLHGAFLMDRARREGIIFLAGGHGFELETDPGKYSGMHRYEERIVDSVFRLLRRS